MFDVAGFIQKANFALSDFEFLQNSDEKVSKLGTGSFSDVKLAREKNSKKLFALKIFDLKASSASIQCLRNEISIHKKLSHSNIIKFHGYICEPTHAYIVLDYAENGNLYSYLHSKVLSEQEVFSLFHQVCLAVQYLHKSDVTHRDIKPENLLLDKHNNIKLCDFGWSASHIHKRRNTLCGTYEYMAPEVISKISYDYRIDIWSLGVLLYELMHREAPYKGRTLQEIEASIKKADLTFNAAIPPDVRDLVEKLLRHNPNERLIFDDLFLHPWIQRHLTRSKQSSSTLSNQCAPIKVRVRSKEKGKTVKFLINKENVNPNQPKTLNQPSRPQLKKTMTSLTPKASGLPLVFRCKPRLLDTQENKENIKPMSQKPVYTLLSTNQAEQTSLQNKPLESVCKLETQLRNNSSPNITKIPTQTRYRLEHSITGKLKKTLRPHALSPSVALKLNTVLNTTLSKPLSSKENSLLGTYKSPLSQKLMRTPMEPLSTQRHYSDNILASDKLYKGSRPYLMQNISYQPTPFIVSQTPNMTSKEIRVFRRTRAYKNLENTFKNETNLNFGIIEENQKGDISKLKISLVNDFPTLITEGDVSLIQKTEGSQESGKNSQQKIEPFAISFNSFYKGTANGRKLYSRLGQRTNSPGLVASSLSDKRALSHKKLAFA